MNNMPLLLIIATITAVFIDQIVNRNVQGLPLSEKYQQLRLGRL